MRAAGAATSVDTHASCAGCRHFDNAPRVLEDEIAGLTVMGSGYASVRADDGLCRLHARYLSSRSRCDGFAARIADRAR